MKGTSHEHHIVPISTYTKTAAGLLILMVLTIAAARLPYWTEGSGLSNFFLNTAAGSWAANIIALGIATLKALLVINIFMGFKFATKLVKLWAMAGFIWFFLFFLMYADYGTRRFEPVPVWSPDKGSAMPRSLPDARKNIHDYEGPISRPRP